ncbi:IS1380 family transposase [Schlesneria sp. DSM 10557]|uniref:IS1380 family transposase n=1 Tax=Schlesneria sp. DSM 10557 TaxID=3044399 RepID=UPI0035A07A62
MKTIIRKKIESRQRRIEGRLDKLNYPADMSKPMMRRPSPQFELSDRAVGTAYGGIGLIHQFVKELGLPVAIDQRLHLFKVHLPYHESDHVLSLAYNALCEGRCLEDLELRRQDEAYLNLLGATRIPDPTTAGDFCRRFQQEHLSSLQDAFDATRLKVWAGQPASFFDCARIDADGSLVETGAECKQGIDITYKGQWGYHPLAVTLANTGEVLRLKNRPGNRPSHEGAAEQLDESIALCRRAGFRKIVLRGDTDFSQTKYLDGWNSQTDVTFVFGYDCKATLVDQVNDLPETSWKQLSRPPRYEVKTSPRAKPEPVKQRIVEERGFKDIHLFREWVAEMPYRPAACQQDYRLIVVRKDLIVSEPRQGLLFDDYRHFFYITNDKTLTAEEVVFSANDRCQQENILAQLNAVRSLHAPVDNLTSNEAYMLMTSLAWNLKAWLALRLPVSKGRWQPRHQEQQTKLLRMEFRTFVNYWLRIPCQVLTTGRRLILRSLAWNSWQSVFFRLAADLAHPLRQ